MAPGSRKMRGQRQRRLPQETPNYLLVLSSRASSFTRCLLNEADGRQAGPPSLVIGVRAATQPECFYLQAPRQSHRFEYLASPESRTSAPCLDRLATECNIMLPLAAFPMHYYGSSAHLVKMTEKSLRRRKLQNPPPELYVCDLIRRLKSATD